MDMPEEIWTEKPIPNEWGTKYGAYSDIKIGKDETSYTRTDIHQAEIAEKEHVIQKRKDLHRVERDYLLDEIAKRDAVIADMRGVISVWEGALMHYRHLDHLAGVTNKVADKAITKANEILESKDE